MSSIHDAAWLNLEETLKENLSTEKAWQKIINFQANLNPKDYWKLIKELDIISEQDEIKEWLEQIVTDTPLPKNVVALWIGIAKLWDSDNDKEFYAIYLTGSDTYNPENADWAVEPSYDPTEKYIIPDALNLIDTILKTDEDNYSFNDWIIPIAYCSLNISNIMNNKLNTNAFTKFNKSLFVTVGYDDGDFIAIEPIT